MPTYTFTGKVLPDRAAVSLPPTKLDGIETIPGDIGFTINSIHISIAVSQVSVIVATDKQVPDIFTLKNGIEALIRAQVDVFGFLTGRGYDLEITSVTGSDGSFLVFGVGIEELEQAMQLSPNKFTELLGLSMSSAYVQLALADFREAIRSPSDTGFYCYRMAETIRQSFAKPEDGDNRSLAWQRLRDSLNVEKSWLIMLKMAADNRRHGALLMLLSTDRVALLKGASTLLDRFCVYLRNGAVPLREPEFPLLVVK
jgi:hypothetical protein